MRDDSLEDILEAGFDNFFIIDSVDVGINSVQQLTQLTIYPNPFTTEINISLINVKEEQIRVELIDLMGRVVDQQEFNNTSQIHYINKYNKGVYFMNIYGNGKLIKTEKLVKF